jgi:hypothetical protein
MPTSATGYLTSNGRAPGSVRRARPLASARTERTVVMRYSGVRWACVCALSLLPLWSASGCGPDAQEGEGGSSGAGGSGRAVRRACQRRGLPGFRRGQLHHRPNNCRRQGHDRMIAWLVAGQGAEHPGMGLELGPVGWLWSVAFSAHRARRRRAPTRRRSDQALPLGRGPLHRSGVSSLGEPSRVRRTLPRLVLVARGLHRRGPRADGASVNTRIPRRSDDPKAR